MTAAVESQPKTAAASGAAATLKRERLFYAVASLILLGMALLGFRYFYLMGGKGFMGNPLTREVVPVILTHAFAMSSWTILLVTQSVLVYRGKLRAHRTWGWVGAVLAVAVVGLGAAMAILSAHYNPTAYMMFSGPKFFLMEMLTEIALFGVLITIAILNRNRAEVHRPFILTATIVVASGALARVPVLDLLAALPPIYAYGPVLGLGALLYLLKWWMTGRHDRWFAIALGSVALVFLISLPIGRSALWEWLWDGYILDPAEIRARFPCPYPGPFETC